MICGKPSMKGQRKVINAQSNSKAAKASRQIV
jgi:hypothetical protein